MLKQIAVLASGGGSNLQSLLNCFNNHDDPDDAAAVRLVICDRSDAGALRRADAAAVPSVLLRDWNDGSALIDTLHGHAIDLVVLAGYLRLVPEIVVREFRGRMINVHPALLPSFGGKGMHGHAVHAAVIASGATISGPTVHFVNEHYDRGTIIAQWPVPVLPADDPELLAARVLRAEHTLLPIVVRCLALGVISLTENGRCRRDINIEGDLIFAPIKASPERLLAAIETGLGLTPL